MNSGGKPVGGFNVDGLSELELQHQLAAGQQRAAMAAQTRAFIAQTAAQVYAALVAKDPPHWKQADLTRERLRAHAAHAHHAAPFLAEALGMVRCQDGPPAEKA